MIFLNDNVLLEKDLTHDNIKPRLLGHWGTCPGLTMIYAHLNRIIRKTGLDALYVVGPGSYDVHTLRQSILSKLIGHGAPAILSCLWLEDSLGTFLPEYPRNYTGLKNLISRFSVPGGFPRYSTLLFFLYPLQLLTDVRLVTLTPKLQEPFTKVVSSGMH